MASPEELQLEQKARSLKLKEDALKRQANQQQRTDSRLKAHQDSVAKKERANQFKTQDLIKRERKLQEDSTLLQRERETFSASQEAAASRRSSSITLLPVLLVACIVGGYFAYQQLEKRSFHYNQIASASKNIDKLANILSLTQDEVLTQSTALEIKKGELDKTKDMLFDLKQSSDQLRREIQLLKGDQATSASEKASLVESADILAQQLGELKVQLEDKYLTIDIIEALVDYQEDRLKNVKGELATKQELLAKHQDSLSEQQSQQMYLEQALNEKDTQLKEKNRSLQTAQEELDQAQRQLTEAEQKLDAFTEATKVPETPVTPQQ